MNSVNTFKKYCPNVFVAECEEKQEKGETIVLNTKYGKEIDCIVHNFLGQTRDKKFLYSIERADGFNSQERAKAKAERIRGYEGSANNRSGQAYEASQEGKDFLSLAEPIKIGHHSEKRHRALIERNWARMDKSVAERKKAEGYASRAEYWERKVNDINLSMPESLEYFEFKKEEAEKNHKDLKDNPEKRRHSYSLTYAKKEVNNMTKNLQIAVKLWGSDEEIQQIAYEKKEEAEKKVTKGKKSEDLIKKYGGFFAFNKEQLLEGYEKIKKEGSVLEGEKVSHLKHGLYLPSKNIDFYLQEM